MRVLSIGLTAMLMLWAGGLQNAGAWQWPVDDVQISGAFGGSTPDGFREGVTLQGRDEKVASVSSGQVIFTSGSDRRDGMLPWTLGDFVAVQHDQGFRSVYAHLAGGSVPSGLRAVREGDTLGRAGETGRTDEKGVELFILDTRENRAVNPLVVLPPVPDRWAPQIADALLSDQVDVPLVEGAAVSEGHWAVTASVTDRIGSREARRTVAPFEVELSVNGKKVSSIRLAYLSFRQGEYYVDPDFRWSYDNLYLGPNRYDLGLAQLVPGENTITIDASDFAGNSSVFEQKVYYGRPPRPEASPPSPQGARTP